MFLSLLVDICTQVVVILDFANCCGVLRSRFIESPDVFKTQRWKNAPDRVLKEFVYKKYNTYALHFPWNEGVPVQIIPAVHGTSESKAWKICTTGFAALQTLDSGFFGKGIYFTTSALYAIPYFAPHGKHAAIIISYILPGNVYPVTEDHQSDRGLTGCALKGGFNSHFVATTRHGNIIATEMEECYDELVIKQETQICPVYVVNLSRGCLSIIKNSMFILGLRNCPKVVDNLIWHQTYKVHHSDEGKC